MLNKRYRLPAFNIKKVCHKGDTLRGKILIVKMLENSSQNSRFAFVISSKAVKKATQRNLIKRRISEIVRSLIDKLETKKDFVFIVKKEASFQELKEEISRLLNV